MIRYFISFMFQTNGGVGNGNCEIHRPDPIRSMDDVAAVTDLLRQQGLANPTLLSFSRFENPDTATTRRRTQPGPLDSLTFDYIRQLLQEQNRALTAGQIAELLGFPVDAVSRVTRKAVQVGRLVVTDGRYRLPRKGDRR